MHSKLLKLSINLEFSDRDPPADKRMMVTAFQNGEFTIEELAQAINEGYAYSYQFYGEVRKSENFKATDIVSVDVDKGMTIEEALSNPIVSHYCSLLYTTPRHTPDRHRFRLVFVLPRTVTDPKEIRAVSRALTRRLTGDMSATDAARFFHGSYNSEPQIFDREISANFLEELIADGDAEPAGEYQTYSGHTSNRARLGLNPHLAIKSKDGSWIRPKDITKTTQVHCPFHPDESPSAFISINDCQNVYLRCLTCQQTWWMNDSNQIQYDFYGFERTIKEIKSGVIDILDREKYPLAQLTDLSSISANNVFISDSEKLSLSNLNPGLTFIKSPKGSGKTTYLSRILRSIFVKYATLDAYEEATFDAEGDVKIYGEDKVLLIGHRQALIGELCERLHLNCYLEDPKDDKQEVRFRQNRYGICLDSLWKIKDLRYDIIVIDEVEQVLSHFLSETIGEARLGLYEIFANLIASAKKVVVLDADLGWVTYNTLTRIVRSKNSLKTPFPTYIYINEWRSKPKQIQLYQSQEHLIGEIERSIRAGKRVFVTSNSKAKIEQIDAGLRQLRDADDNPFKIITITSETSSNKASQDFIKNIKTRILDLNAVLSSPSLGTGIDITFENDAEEIDCVFGIFENQINSHFEIDQQLCRVRHPKEVHVWVSPRKFNFETDFNVVTADYLSRNLIDIVETGAIQAGKQPSEELIHPFYYMAALVTAQQRASKNSLRANFIEYKERNGFQFQTVDKDNDIATEGKTLKALGKQIKTDEERQNILNARPLNQLDYQKYKAAMESNDSVVSSSDHYSFLRTTLELFYRQPISIDLIKMDDAGNFRQAVKLLQRVLNKPSFKKRDHIKATGVTEKSLKEVRTDLLLFRDENTGAVLIYSLLSLTPFFKNGKFDCNVVFTKKDLLEFGITSVDLKKFVETQLGVHTQSDAASTKQVQHLGKLLKTIGLALDNSGTKKTGKNKTYYYKLSQDLLNQRISVLDRREEIGGWEFVNNLHNFTYSESDIESLLQRG